MEDEILDDETVLVEQDVNPADIRRTFLGGNEEYYLKEWAAFDENPDRRRSFNWAAFLVPVLWLLHRKMYGHAILVLLFTNVPFLVNPDLDFFLFTTFPVGFIGLHLFFGFFANYIYYKWGTEKINFLLDYYDGQAKYLDVIKARGGVRPILAFFILVVINVAVFLYQLSTADLNWAPY